MARTCIGNIDLARRFWITHLTSLFLFLFCCYNLFGVYIDELYCRTGWRVIWISPIYWNITNLSQTSDKLYIMINTFVKFWDCYDILIVFPDKLKNFTIFILTFYIYLTIIGFPNVLNMSLWDFGFITEGIE